MLGSGGVLAHQGGWDEALMVIAPVGLFVGLLWAATRRAATTGDAAARTDRPSADEPERGALHPAEPHGDR